MRWAMGIESLSSHLRKGSILCRDGFLMFPPFAASLWIMNSMRRNRKQFIKFPGYFFHVQFRGMEKRFPRPVFFPLSVRAG